ncbi:NlpC/P60 family protein [Bacteroidota bacterium]
MTKYGISELSVIPVRKEPNDRSEMITQILFGETFQIIEETIKWSYIKSSFDDYLGYIDNGSISIIDEKLYNDINTNNQVVTQNLINTILNSNNEPLILTAGSTLPKFNKAENTFQISNNRYTLLDADNDKQLNITSISKQFLNCPYVWGGKNALGIDCSGFVQVVFKILGEKIPRDTNQQVNIGNSVDFISNARPGDIAFFDDNEGNIIHVGILLNTFEIIHASGKVRIDRIDQQGINNLEKKKYTHKLRVIKRII